VVLCEIRFARFSQKVLMRNPAVFGAKLLKTSRFTWTRNWSFYLKNSPEKYSRKKINIKL
jgi:hypothetical protein